jgi:hypothetical protein
MRSFYILNKRVSEPSNPESRGTIGRRTGWRARLRYRDIIWAFHSETQGLLLSASLAACQGKMTWNDARALGVFLWLNSIESMVRKATSLVLTSILFWITPEIPHGSHRPDGIYGWRFPRSSCQFPVLFRSRKAQVGSGSLAAGRMAQRAGNHVTVLVQRFYATAMANCSPQKRVCSAEQAPFR